MIKIGQPTLLAEDVDGIAPGAAGARRQPSPDGAPAALYANNQPIDSLDREDDPSEDNTADDPKFAHRTHRVRAGSKQLDETSMP